MIRVNLSDATVARLADVFRTTAEVKLRRRVPIVLMAHRGRPHGHTATDLGCSRSSVQRWLHTYLDRGLGGSQPRKAKGATPKSTPDPAPILRQWVIDGPAEPGSGRAGWTCAELADHRLNTHGIRIGRSALQVSGARHGIRPYRPTYKAPRGDPDQQAGAREERAALKNGRPRANSSS